MHMCSYTLACTYTVIPITYLPTSFDGQKHEDLGLNGHDKWQLLEIAKKATSLLSVFTVHHVYHHLQVSACQFNAYLICLTSAWIIAWYCLIFSTAWCLMPNMQIKEVLFAIQDFAFIKNSRHLGLSPMDDGPGATLWCPDMRNWWAHLHQTAGW